jgi:uncharacterized protein (DUF58 family)
VKKFIQGIFLGPRFFLAFGIIVFLFFLSFVWPYFFPLAQTLLVILFAVLLADFFLLYNPLLRLSASRKLPRVLSLGSDNPVFLELKSDFPLPLKAVIVDELPFQLQERNFKIKSTLKPRDPKIIEYKVRPTTRGGYSFGRLHLFLNTFLGLVERRYSFDLDGEIPVYPSVIQMKQFELKTLPKISRYHGIKKLRRLGHSYEFEQIKNYVQGDDIRSINWKATGRKAELMVNQYEDEKSQQVYNLIDNSRNMRMPFNGLSLLDYAINTSLVIANTSLQKQDRAGLLTFSDKIGTFIRAERGSGQLQRILDGLYKEEPRNLEANYELLYLTVRNMIPSRSLLFLYTNFESILNMERVLPIIRKINKRHLMVVVIFENTQISEFAEKETKSLEDIYLQTIARKFILEKGAIIQMLRQFGIQSVFSRPEDLSVNTINKYLELKARGMI